MDALFAEHDPGDETLIQRLKTFMEKHSLTPDNITAYAGINSVVLALWMQQKYTVKICAFTKCFFLIFFREIIER
jgi:hypothetical protein